MEQEKAPEFFGIGQRFHYRDEYTEGTTYLLARVDESTVALVNIYTGCTWSEPQNVMNVCKITAEELRELINDDEAEFTLIGDKEGCEDIF